MKIMAIDYGDAHTGIAISDVTGTLAGFTTVITAYRPEAVAQRVAELAKEHGAEELVLGHPVNMDGSLGPRSEKAKAMQGLLEEATGLPVVLWDERLTTRQATGIMQAQSVRIEKRRSVVNQIAAVLILQAFLDGQATDAPDTPAG